MLFPSSRSSLKWLSMTRPSSTATPLSFAHEAFHVARLEIDMARRALAFIASDRLTVLSI
jgi:hypothetical protein